MYCSSFLHYFLHFIAGNTRYVLYKRNKDWSLFILLFCIPIVMILGRQKTTTSTVTTYVSEVVRTQTEHSAQRSDSLITKLQGDYSTGWRGKLGRLFRSYCPWAIVRPCVRSSVRSFARSLAPFLATNLGRNFCCPLFFISDQTYS